MQPLNLLKWVKVKVPRVIPESLIECVKGRTFTPLQFYEYQEFNTSNPNNLLFALIDDKAVIHGYLWMEINVLDSSLFVNTFSISKEHWGKGEAMQVAMDFVSHIQDKHKCPRVFWITTNEKFFLKKGFKRSKNVLMEYNKDK